MWWRQINPTLQFRRGMVNVPVESMKSEGLFWFTNLTIGDPYYLLPLFNSLSIWAQVCQKMIFHSTTISNVIVRIYDLLVLALRFPVDGTWRGDGVRLKNGRKTKMDHESRSGHYVPISMLSV